MTLVHRDGGTVWAHEAKSEEILSLSDGVQYVLLPAQVESRTSSGRDGKAAQDVVGGGAELVGGDDHRIVRGQRGIVGAKDDFVLMD